MVQVSKASVADVPQIKELIEYHAKKNKMLSRSLSYLFDNIRDYFIAKDGGELIGCLGLHITWSDLAEIKSLAVHPDYMGQGVGKALIDSASTEAKSMGIMKIFTLSLEPEFFIRHGFQNIDRDSLPMKIWGECIQCPKYPECDESALELLLD
jgi:amino-acid N-acetyltransferase